MKTHDKQLKLDILKAIIEKQDMGQGPKTMHKLCDSLKKKYNRTDIIAALRYLLNEELITATDSRGDLQKGFNEKLCEGGGFLLDVPPSGRTYYVELSKSYLRRQWEKLNLLSMIIGAIVTLIVGAIWMYFFGK